MKAWSYFLPNDGQFASRRDVHDALEAAELLDCTSPRIVSSTNRVLTIDDLSRYDDLSSWPEWRRGEFRDLSRDEIKKELLSFRGSAFANRAIQWVDGAPIPAIVIVITPEQSYVGDGRGRSSVAIALDRPLPATLLNIRCN